MMIPSFFGNHYSNCTAESQGMISREIPVEKSADLW